MAVRMFAAIDVGSFALELGIYEISDKTGIRNVEHIRHVIALGSDTFSEGKISYDLVDEMCRVLEKFTETMKMYRVKDYRAYATTAMREAKNSRIILDQIRVRTGLEVHIISNSEQRFISYKAVASKGGEFNQIIQKGTAIVDVGFGSAQISLFDKDSLVATQNLPLGSLRLRSQLAKIPASVDGHRLHIEEIVDNELITFRKMYLRDRQITNLIGIGDNILYLMRRLGIKGGENRVDSAAMHAFYDKLSQMTIDQIEENFGVNSEYAALLLPAATVYTRILDITGAEMFWIPAIGICDGIAAEYASHNQVLEQYAMNIFDSTRRFHGLGDRERLLLQIAVTLHACGKFISMKNSNECGYTLIMSTEIIGLSHLEREIIANVVRYNIRDFDYDMMQLETEAGQDLAGVSDRTAITILIAKLTAILRLANSMDKTHKSKLIDCRMAVREGQLVITTGYKGDLALESASFEQKAAFFEEIFGIRPVLKQKRRV